MISQTEVFHRAPELDGEVSDQSGHELCRRPEIESVPRTESATACPFFGSVGAMRVIAGGWLRICKIGNIGPGSRRGSDCHGALLRSQGTKTFARGAPSGLGQVCTRIGDDGARV